MSERSTTSTLPEPTTSAAQGDVATGTAPMPLPEPNHASPSPPETTQGAGLTPRVESVRMPGPVPSTDAPTELALELTESSARTAQTVHLKRATLTHAGDPLGSETPSDEPEDESEIENSDVGPRRAEQYVGYIIDGRYHIEAVLAQGGMGVVYRARHRLIDKAVAVKVLRPELADNREITQRFLTEAQAASSIGSEHIVDITDYGELPDGATYIVMEYLEGKALGAELGKGSTPMPIERILEIARQMCDGLQHAHDAGIVHRDLKPDNVFLTHRGKHETFVKILDFGIAKVASSQNQITRAGRIFGTPHYMSPEQARGQELDNRSDIYSMGVILYELVSGRLPFEGENPLGILTQHMYSEPRPLHEVCTFGRVSVGLEAIVSKCLLKEPWQRYGSMSELGEDLEREKRGQAPRAIEDLKRLSVSPPALKRRLGKSREHTGYRGVLLTVLLVAVGVGIAWAAPRRHALLDQWQRLTQSEPEQLELGPEASGAPGEEDPNLRAVALVLSPVDAHVYRGNQDLGMMPITLRLRQGQRVKLTVRREGYQSKTLEIDASEPRRVIELVPLAGTKPLTESRPQLQGPTKARVITIEEEISEPAPAPRAITDAGAPRAKAPRRAGREAGAPRAPRRAVPPVEDILAPLEPNPEQPLEPPAPVAPELGPAPSAELPNQTWPPPPVLE